MGDVLLGFFDAGSSVVLGQVIGVELDWGLGESFLFPLIWRQEFTGFSNSLEGGFGEVTEGSGATTG